MNQVIRRRLYGVKWAVAGIVLVLAALMGAGGVAADDSIGGSGRLSLASASEAKTAPDFDLPDLDGRHIRLSEYKGKRPVLIYFWATWCPYCVAAKPKVAKLREEIKPEEMEILGVNVGGSDSLERVKRFQTGHPSNWPILYDGDSKVAQTYRVQGIPLFVLVDKDGNEAYRGTNLPEDPLKYLK